MTPPMIPYPIAGFTEQQTAERARDFFGLMERRRSLRHFSDRHVPVEVMEDLIRTASSAPSGAHRQPWTFCLVGNPDIKRRIREAAEAEEYTNYHGRMSEEWLEDLQPFGTDWEKPFLEIAPWLVVIFKKPYDLEGDEKHKNYYVNESVGLAAGFLIAAIHQAGLSCLTHTPSPMNFLQRILGRPENERPFLLLPVGYPAPGAQVPDLQRKPLGEVLHKF
ncbi:MAG: nitroreductase family protein [Saprospiraceae bacterium]|jgi:iodotyrosine deiodinase